MKVGALEGVDLARHERLLRRALGADAPLAVCDRAGELIFANREANPLEAALRELAAARVEFALSGERAGRIELDSKRELHYAPIFGAAAEPVAWLTALLDRIPSHHTVAGESLADTSAAISSELRMRDEIDGLTQELSKRYEEVNLVYGLEQKMRALREGPAAAAAVLRDFVDALDVGLAVFVVRDAPEALRAAPSGRTFANLDLVATAIEGQLFHFVSCSRQPLILNEPDDERREYLFFNLPYRVLVCPVEDDGRVYASLALVRGDDAPFFSNGDRNLAMAIAAQLALVLSNQRMLASAQRFGDQLAAALIQAIEAKDPYTSGHSERVRELALGLGRAAGMPSADLVDVGWGALLHDVGKLGVPDRILCKVGRLTPEEYTLVRTHPERGHEILRHIEYLGRNARDAARFHHERFDGSGYPHGLSGLQIPLHARVTAVADTYDAITSSRAYRPSSPHERAIGILREVSGTQLDPELVQTFARLCDDESGWLARVRSRRSAIHD